MNRPAHRFQFRSLDFIFYGTLWLGNLIFAGLETSGVMTLLLLLFNGLLKIPAGRFLEEKSRLASLTIRSLLSLGFFPFVWLACRLLTGQTWPLWPGILIAAGLLYFLKAKKSDSEKTMKGDFWGLAAIWLLILVLTWIPFSRIGYSLPGKLAYRAYFSSDYLKHYSVVESLNQGSLPPANLYFQGQPLHYYWLPYAVPAAVARLTGSTAKAMFAFSFTVNFLFILMLWMLGRKSYPRRKWIPFWPVLFVITPSLEGLYLWATRARFSFNQFLQIGRGVNIDGLTRWLWNLPQIDTFLRALLYTPQHLLSLAFLLLFLYVLSLNKERPWLLALGLALSLAASFFIGGIILIIWALYIGGREIFRLILKRQSFICFAAALARNFTLPLLVLALSLMMKMVSFEGSGLFIKPITAGQAAILIGLNMGFLFWGGIGGLLAHRFPERIVYSLILIVSMFLVLFVRVANFESDISLKAGLIVILVSALLTGGWGEKVQTAKFLPALTLLIVLPGLMTLVLDIKNSADIHNRRFTSTVSFEEMQMLYWVRDHVPADRTVQNYPPARTWNLSAIPAFSGRRMVVGDRMHGQIFQVSPDLYLERIEALGRALARLPSSKDELRRLGADYLFWGEDETRYFKFIPELPVVNRIGRTFLFSLGTSE